MPQKAFPHPQRLHHLDDSSRGSSCSLESPARCVPSVCGTAAHLPFGILAAVYRAGNFYQACLSVGPGSPVCIKEVGGQSPSHLVTPDRSSKSQDLSSIHKFPIFPQTLFSSQMNSISIQIAPHLTTLDMPLRATLAFIPSHPCPTSAHPVISARPL